MNLDEAFQLATDLLKVNRDQFAEPLFAMKEYAYPFKGGWIFPSQTKKFIQTRNRADSALGAPKIIVDADSRSVIQVCGKQTMEYTALAYLKYRPEPEKLNLILLAGDSLS